MAVSACLTVEPHDISECLESHIDCIRTFISKSSECQFFKLLIIQRFWCVCPNGAQVFLTVDDKFRRNAQQIPDIKITVYNPLMWLSEILENGNQ